MFRLFPALSPSRLFSRNPVRPFALAVFLAAFVGSLSAQEKPPITVDDYGQWKSINSTQIFKK